MQLGLGVVLALEQAEHLVALVVQQLGEVLAVLAGDAGDQRAWVARHPSSVRSRSAARLPARYRSRSGPSTGRPAHWRRWMRSAGRKGHMTYPGSRPPSLHTPVTSQDGGIALRRGDLDDEADRARTRVPDPGARAPPPTVPLSARAAPTFVGAPRCGDALRHAAGFVDEVVVGGLPFPTAIAFTPDDTMFIALKSGIVRVLPQRAAAVRRRSSTSPAGCTTTTTVACSGITVHPEFPLQPYVYLLYTHDPPGVYPDASTRPRHASTPARTAQLMRVEADAATGYTTAKAGTETVHPRARAAREPTSATRTTAATSTSRRA